MISYTIFAFSIFAFFVSITTSLYLLHSVFKYNIYFPYLVLSIVINTYILNIVLYLYSSLEITNFKYSILEEWHDNGFISEQELMDMNVYNEDDRSISNAEFEKIESLVYRNRIFRNQLD